MILRILNWFKKKATEKKAKGLMCGWVMGFGLARSAA